MRSVHGIMDRNDSDTTVAELQLMIKGFCDERGWERFHNNKDLAIGIVTEASELLELFRFKDDAQIEGMMSSPRREDVVDELCDAFYFILRFAQMNGIDLTRGLHNKMVKNAEKYPVSKAKDCNLKYDEY